jgi:hypothetical protein
LKLEKKGGGKKGSFWFSGWKKGVILVFWVSTLGENQNDTFFGGGFSAEF